MTHSPADVVRWFLVADGVGTDPGVASALGWPAYTGREPTTPDDVITTYDTDGADTGRSMPTGEAMGANGLQVRVRATNHREGYDKAAAVRRAMETAYQEAIAPGTDPERYLLHCFTRIGDVLTLGREPGSSRYLFTVNAMVHVRPL